MHQIGCLSQSDGHWELAVFCATCSDDPTRAGTSSLIRSLKVDNSCQSDATSGVNSATKNGVYEDRSGKKQKEQRTCVRCSWLIPSPGILPNLLTLARKR